MKKIINILERFDGVAGGDVILMIQPVGAIPGGPDAAYRGPLIFRVSNNMIPRIESNQLFYKLNCWNEAYLNKNSAGVNQNFFFRNRVFVRD